MADAALDPSLREALTSDSARDADESVGADDLEAARGIIWWGLASVLFWLLVAALVL
jgi:hypothetical protein